MDLAANPAIMQAVEQLDYRVTVGDVATKAGLEINFAQQGLLALASDAGGHLQVAESGDIAYLFPRNFRTILRNKYRKIRRKEWWDKVKKYLFYALRVSFGILLIASIVLIVAAIAIIVMSASGSSDRNNNSRSSRSSGGMMFLPRFWIGPDLFWVFHPNYYQRRRYSQQQRRAKPGNEPEMNFLEAIFSFLFGDGNPNADIEERRWQLIGSVIRNSKGAVIAEQIAPYLDNVDADEDYMLSVLSRFNGYPEVSPAGEIIYYFPELQVTATTKKATPVSDYLHEFVWRFSQADSGQIMLAIGLGAFNLVGALVLGSLLAGGELAAELGGLVAFVGSIYGLLLVYGIGFLVIPLVRYFWIKQKNPKIEARNQDRRARAHLLQSSEPELLHKLGYARQFASQTVLRRDNIAYSTEEDLLDQSLKQADKTDEEWRRRLES